MRGAKASLLDRCYLHPHRVATARCQRCSTRLCEECVRTYQGQTLCDRCVDELQTIEAERPTARDRLLGAVRSFRNLLIGLAIVGILAVPAYFLVRNLASQKITPEEWARFRYAAAGSFQTPDGVNVNSTVLGAQIVRFTSQRPGYEAAHLINEYTLPDYPGWRSADARFPQEIVVALQSPATVSKVILYQQANEPRETWARAFEILVSTTGPDAGFRSVGRWELQQVTDPQRFTFAPTNARWIMLRILSNDGSSDYTSLDEFDAYVVNQATPTP